MAAESLSDEIKRKAPDTTEREIRAIFDELDTNHNGRLEAEELKASSLLIGSNCQNSPIVTGAPH